MGTSGLGSGVLVFSVVVVGGGAIGVDDGSVVFVAKGSWVGVTPKGNWPERAVQAAKSDNKIRVSKIRRMFIVPTIRTFDFYLDYRTKSK